MTRIKYVFRRRIHAVKSFMLTGVLGRLGFRGFYKLGLSGLDDEFLSLIDKPGGFFVEAGANDGMAQSNTYYLEKVRGWRGVLVEPMPELFLKCKKRRGGSRVFNCALVASDFTRDYVEMEYANLMSCVKGALKTDEEARIQIEEGLKIQGLGESYTVKVKARTLQSILDEVDAPRDFDFLSLDVEGYEVSVLRGLDFDKYRPKYILIEARYFDECDSILKSHYALVRRVSRCDYLYVRRSV